MSAIIYTNKIINFKVISIYYCTYSLTYTYIIKKIYNGSPTKSFIQFY